jgi:hypothetical protein
MTKEETKVYMKAYYKKNRESIAIKQKAYYESNRGDLLLKMKEYSKTYRDDPVIKKRIAKSCYKRRLNNPIEKMKNILRTRIYYFLKSKKVNKSKKTEALLGCSYDKVKEHLEALFSKGMDWNNHGKWHIDHIIPLDSANNEEEINKLFHYTNLQPLWALDNYKKSNNY